MSFLNRFTRRNQSPMTNENKKNLAETSAYYNTKQKFGRAPQARVANILETPGTFKRTNNAAIHLQEQIHNFSVNLGKTLQSFGSKETVKSALNNVIGQLDSQMKEYEKGSQVGGGTVSLTLNIPIWVGKLIIAILKAVVFAIALLFALGITAMSNGDASVLTSLFTGFYGKDNNKKPEEVQAQKVQEWAPKSVKTRRNTMRKH